MSDLIDRQAAIEAITDELDRIDHVPQWVFDRLEWRLKQLPPAQLGTNLAEVGTDCISRQQAINALRDYLVEKRCPDDGTLTCRLIENEVINKLPSATDKNVGDTISRKAMIDALHTWFRDGFDEDKWWNSTHVLAAIEGLPPVTPKQRTGHWIPVGVAEVVGGESAQWGSAIAYHKCSVCNEQALKDDFEQEVLSDFCPHCGAKMEGDTE